MLARIAILTLSLFATAHVKAAEERFRPLTVELISECDAIQPGQNFHLGIRQKIAPGYHSYWRSPGSVGMPMGVAWSLPAGFTAGELQWPLPETGTMSAYTIWGFHNEALLVTEISVPSDAPPGSVAAFTVNANWMCCGRSCHPDNETLTITLPVRQVAVTNVVAQKSIDRTRANQPRQNENWQLSVAASDVRYELTIRSGDRSVELPAAAYFFDYDRQISSDKGQTFRHLNGALRLTLLAEEHTGERLPRLRGMLVAEPAWPGGFRALAVDIPIAGRTP